MPAIVSGCLSLLSGSVATVNHRLEWPNKAERQNDFASRLGEVVRGINTECTLGHLNGAKNTSKGDFICHTSRLEENAPNIPECIGNLTLGQNEWRHRTPAVPKHRRRNSGVVHGRYRCGAELI
jgi:hypothetical protein